MRNTKLWLFHLPVASATGLAFQLGLRGPHLGWLASVPTELAAIVPRQCLKRQLRKLPPAPDIPSRAHFACNVQAQKPLTFGRNAEGGIEPPLSSKELRCHQASAMVLVIHFRRAIWLKTSAKLLLLLAGVVFRSSPRPASICIYLASARSFPPEGKQKLAKEISEIENKRSQPSCSSRIYLRLSTQFL